jgi:hypothetical protein
MFIRATLRQTFSWYVARCVVFHIIISASQSFQVYPQELPLRLRHSLGHRKHSGGLGEACRRGPGSLDSETLDDQENSKCTLLDSTVCFLTPLEIDASLKVNKNDKSFAPDADHQNIFQLTTAIVKKTQCSVNIVLCARVALMVRSPFFPCSSKISMTFQRKVYLKHPGTNFWDKLDLRLAKIRKDADGDSKKITKYVVHTQSFFRLTYDPIQSVPPYLGRRSEEAREERHCLR